VKNMNSVETTIVKFSI